MFFFENMMNTSGEYQDGSAIVKIECTHKELAVLLVLVREHLKTEPLFTEALSVRAQAFVKGSAAILQGNNGSKVEA